MNVYIGNREFAESVKDVKKTFHLVWPLLNSNRLPREILLEKFGKCIDNYKLVFDVEKADFCILPYSWNHYYETKQTEKLKDFILQCKNAGKEIVTVNLNDSGVKPLFEDVIILRPSGYQSRRLSKQFGMPIFFSDPVNEYFNDEIFYRKKNMKPVVGFCGQGKQKAYKYLGVSFRTALKNMMYYSGVSKEEPEVLYPSTLRRNRVLTLLQKSNKVVTDFIIHEKYKAGVKSKEDKLRSKIEFYNNIRNTDYTVCIRGGGNFSVRIYETLANGRIPLYINTDSILPYDNFIDWKKHVVWVEENDIKYADSMLADFHNEIHPDDFIRMQMNNRKLWLDYLSFQGFYCHLAELINYVSKKEII
jgi:hypothetical protein